MSLSGRWGLGTYQGDAPLEIMNRILQELQLAQWVERLKVFYMKVYERLLGAGDLRLALGDSNSFQVLIYTLAPSLATFYRGLDLDRDHTRDCPGTVCIFWMCCDVRTGS